MSDWAESTGGDPENLGPYRIGRPLGRGGMGAVYEATHQVTGELVAVKLIAAHANDDERFRRRFEAEFKALEKLKHPGIVRLIGYGEQAGRMFYSMECVTGRTLQTVIREADGKRLDWQTALPWTIQIASALKHAHDYGIIHRDLKPANLIITNTPDGQSQVKIVDFGIAKVFGIGENTMAGSVLGTADFMAPEQAGEGPITPRTDLYALGSVMYAMLAGRAPFSGRRVTEMIESLRRDKPVPLDLIRPELPREIVEIVDELLQKNPADRPPTARKVLNRLQSMHLGLSQRRDSAGSSAAPADPELAVTSMTEAVDLEKTLVTSPLADATSGETNFDATRIASGPTVGAVTGGRSTRSSTQTPTQLIDPARPVTSATGTHFASAGQGVTTAAGGVPGDKISSLVATASSVVLIVGLLACIGLIGWTVLGPSADTMYAAIRDDMNRGTINVASAEQFIARYADDERADEVRRWAGDADFSRQLARLRAAARHEGDRRELSLAELSLLSIADQIEDPEDSPVDGPSAIDRLAAWRRVYDFGVAALPEVDATEPPADQSLAKLARWLQPRAEAAAEVDPFARRQRELRRLIEQAHRLPPEAMEQRLAALRTLYGEQRWAAGILPE